MPVKADPKKRLGDLVISVILHSLIKYWNNLEKMARF